MMNKVWDISWSMVRFEPRLESKRFNRSATLFHQVINNTKTVFFDYKWVLSFKMHHAMLHELEWNTFRNIRMIFGFVLASKFLTLQFRWALNRNCCIKRFFAREPPSLDSQLFSCQVPSGLIVYLADFSIFQHSFFYNCCEQLWIRHGFCHTVFSDKNGHGERWPQHIPMSTKADCSAFADISRKRLNSRYRKGSIQTQGRLFWMLYFWRNLKGVSATKDLKHPNPDPLTKHRNTDFRMLVRLRTFQHCLVSYLFLYLILTVEACIAPEMQQ